MIKYLYNTNIQAATVEYKYLTRACSLVVTNTDVYNIDLVFLQLSQLPTATCLWTDGILEWATKCQKLPLNCSHFACKQPRRSKCLFLIASVTLGRRLASKSRADPYNTATYTVIRVFTKHRGKPKTSSDFKD